MTDEELYWARLKKDYSDFIRMKRRTDKDAEGILSLTEDIRGVLSSIRGEEEDARDGGFVPAADAAGDDAPAAPASEAPLG